MLPTNQLKIIDVEGVACRADEVSWREYRASEPDGFPGSVPELVESSADMLRTSFLDCAHALSSTRVGSKTMAEHLLVRPSLSYWWMMPSSHLPNLYEASWINDAMKCLALEEWVRRSGFRGSVTFVSRDKVLSSVLASFCARVGLRFDAVVPASESSNPTRAGYRFKGRAAGHLSIAKAAVLPKSLRSLRDAPSDLCVFDHLTYLDPVAASEGRFRSGYWGSLVDLLREARFRVNWVHHLLPHPEVPTVGTARAVLTRFNQSGSDRHFLVEDAINAAIGLRAFRDWSRLRQSLPTLLSADWSQLGRPPGSDVDLSPWLVPMLRSSLAGVACLRQCIRLGLLERICKWLPHQSLGIYIQENQPWEMALVHAWRSAGHGKLFGIQHSTVRYWDLRNFYSVRAYSHEGPASLPRPNAVAVNGPLAQRQYSLGGYPGNEVARVEAVRYPHLFGLGPVRVRPRECFRVLVCGDNVPGSNEALIQIVGAALPLLPPRTEIRFKSHPAAPVQLGSSSSIAFAQTEAPLRDLFLDVDLVVTGQTTSASLEAMCAGLRVAVFRDGRVLNTSPLFGCGIECFFSSAMELAAIASAGYSRAAPASHYFDLDPGLPGWKALLGISSTQS